VKRGKDDFGKEKYSMNFAIVVLYLYKVKKNKG
jgi:hypothetical protein